MNRYFSRQQNLIKEFDNFFYGKIKLVNTYCLNNYLPKLYSAFMEAYFHNNFQFIACENKKKQIIQLFQKLF